jgi:hypothetical protein
MSSPYIYNGAFVGCMAGPQRWLESQDPFDYTAQAIEAALFATAVDAAIPAPLPGYEHTAALLVASLSQAFWSDRVPHDQGTYEDEAEAIAAEYAASLPDLRMGTPTVGESAFSTTSASFVQPAVGGSVAVSMLSTSWIESGLGIYLTDGGYYTAGTPADLTHCTLTLSLPATATPPGGTVATGKGIGPAGPYPPVTTAGHLLQLDSNLQPLWGPLPTAESITSFTTTITLLEAGATLTNPSFAATYNQAPTSAFVVDNQGTGTQNLTSPFASFSYTASYTKSILSSVTWTLSASRPVSGTATRNVSASWGFRVYRGAAASVVTAADIQALAHNVLTTTRVIANYAAESTGSNYDWYAAPTSYGTPTFTDASTNLAVPFDAIGTVSVTNANGVAVNYSLYRSHFPGIGTAGTIVLRIS